MELIELMEKAAKFLNDHTEFNEIELSNKEVCIDIKVRLVRISPGTVVYPGTWYWQYQPEKYPFGRPI